jgi:glycosyltransferase involved in cell wall biosynthesis
MKIAIDSGPLSSGHAVRGIGVYTRELLKALKMNGVDVSKEDLSKYDIVHFTSFKPFVISLPYSKPKRTKFVLTIYDLIPLIYPSHYPPGVKGKINWEINKILIKRNVDSIITISETSKKDICKFLGVDPKIVHVTYLAPRSIFKKIDIKKRHDLPDRFALYVGDVNFNKNIPNLIKACGIAKILLVIAGKQAKDIDKEDLDHAELKHLKHIDWSGVTRLGFVSDENLVEIYNHANVFVQPSFYEGFGLGVLEAVACGTPVVAAKTQALVEIAEGAITFVDPNDPEMMAREILRAAKNGKLPRNYSWGKTATETLNVYKRI